MTDEGGNMDWKDFQRWCRLFLRITKIIFAFTRKIFQFFLFIKRRLPNFVIRNVATVSDSLTFSLGLVALSLGLVALSLGVRTQNPRTVQWDELPQDQEERLVAFLRQNDFLRRADAEHIWCCKRTTASRLLNSFCEKGIIRNAGTPRMPIYVLASNEAGQEAWTRNEATFLWKGILIQRKGKN